MSRPRILIVEDNAISRRLLLLTLGGGRYELIEAADARTALAHAAERLPDLVLTDLGLPDLDGLELLARLRAMPGAEGLPVIAVSGFVARLERARAAACGFTDMLPKPVDTDLLLRTVELHLPADRGASRALPRPPSARRRVLVADDDPVQLRLLTRLVAQEGFEVATATSGAEALERAREWAPDAFVLDVLMPQPDGFRACLLLRQEPRFADVPIVLVTSAFVSSEDARLGESVGASAFVVRSPGLEPVREALLRAFEAPPRVEAAPPAALDVERYAQRIVLQLERQAALNVCLGQRTSQQAVQLSVLGAIAESIVQRRPGGPDLTVVLEQCLDTGGISAGAILTHEDGRLAVEARVGLADDGARDLAAFLAAPDRLAGLFAADGPTTLPLDGLSLVPVATQLEPRGGAVAVTFPLVCEGARLGLLALVSQHPEVTSADRLAFLRSVAAQLAQAMMLTRVVTRLTESEGRFRQLALAIDDAFCLADVETRRLLYVSPSFERMWGRPLADAERWLEAVHAEDRERVRRAYEAAFAGEAFDELFRIPLPAGGQRWLRKRVVAIRDAAGRVARLAGIASDVTALVLASERQERAARVATFNAEVGAALAHEADLDRALQRCTDAAVARLDAALARLWLLDDDGRTLVLRASSGLYTHLDGAHGRVTLGQHEVGRIGESRAPHLTNDVLSDPHVDRAWAEREGLVAFAGYPLLVAGRLLGVLGLFARRALDDTTLAALAFSADVLAVSVARHQEEATRASLEVQLRQAQKMEAVGRLAGGVAHDFNNLLTVMMGYADLALGSLRTDDPLRRGLEQIHKAGARASSLTQQLLVFSRHQKLEQRVLDLNAIVRDLERMLERLLGEDLALVMDLAPDVGRVKADAGQLEQVLLNLVVNARDAMPRGGRLTISTRDVDLDGRHGRLRGTVPPGPYVRIAVSDTGSGIPPDALAHIFEPFFTTKEAGKGTGLGLATVYGIVQGVGGAIAVSTQVGVGTTFEVYLPRVEGSVQVAPARPSGEGLRGTETVLLVEDDDLVRDLAQGVLEAGGYRVIPAANGGEALLAVEREPAIDVVITDVVMPHMSGRDLVRRLEQARPGLRVLYVSGYTSGVALHDDVTGSGAHFLQKPFTPGELTQTLRGVLDAAVPS